MQKLAICNDTTVLADPQAQVIAAGIQIQISRDFAPWYGIDVEVVFVPNGQQPPADTWGILVLDDSANQPGALGYHATQSGKPWGIVGVKDDIANGANPSITASHEALELLADAYVFSVVVIDTQMGGFRGGITANIAQEVSDACEADRYGYGIIVSQLGQPDQTVTVSDFVLPHWFGGEVPAGYAGKYSFTGAVKEAFGIDQNGAVHGLLPGGYIGIMTYRHAGGWTTVNAQADPHVQAFAQKVDAMLPPGKAHTLLHDGQLDENPPKYSRRARVVERMSQ